MNDQREIELLAKEARKRREQARAEGDNREAQRWDAAEREAYRQLPDGDLPCVGDDLRNI